MTINSMTGFARVEGAHGDDRWIWEVRSVNGRGLDTRWRLPAGFEGLEMSGRKAVQARFRRGNLSLSLQLSRTASAQTYRINRPLLNSLVKEAKALAKEIEAAPPRVDGLLAIRGVVEPEDADLSAERKSEMEVALSASLDEAIAKLAEARASEGAALAEILSAQIDEIARLNAAAEGHPSRRPEAVRARLAQQVGQLLDAGLKVSDERLAQEAALLAAKADIAEEIDRISAHVAAARDLLNAADAPVGRR